MKSPYLWFVKLVAKLVDGKYPEHYDSSVKMRVRVLWIVGIPLMVVVSYSNSEVLRSGPITTQNFTSQPTTLGITILIIVFSLLTWNVASLRAKSIKKHVLETNIERVVNENSYEAASDAIKMYSYAKTYAALAVIMHLNEGVRFFIQSDSLVAVLFRFAFFLPSMYYFFVLIELLFPLLSRWGKQYIKNDNKSDSSNKIES
jgi:uncharacterized membrane protein